MKKMKLISVHWIYYYTSRHRSDNMEMVLASKSPRREELLKYLTDDFKIIVSDFDENSIEFRGDVGEYVKELAYNKAMSVSKQLKQNSVVIGCDTLVSLNGEILGKPKDKKNAYEMVSKLSGKTHQVYSGLAVIVKQGEQGESMVEYSLTDVTFDKLSEGEIVKYIETKEPYDKAGAYGIQGKGGTFVSSISGCYYNVVGLPLNKLKNMLGELGVNL